MTPVTFDTRKAVRNLQAAGFSNAQADAMVDTLAEAFTDTVATKSDIVAVRSDIDKLQASTKSDIVAVRSDVDKLQASTKSDIAEVKAEIGRLEGRVFRALWIQGAGIVGLVVILTKLL